MYFPNKTLKQDMLSMNIWGLVWFCLCILLKKSIQTGLASRTFYNRETNLNKFKFCQESLLLAVV